MTFKEEVYLHFVQLIDEKILQLQRVLDDLKESGANETKSTAGDKHETALAMLQIEQENKRIQLLQLTEQKAMLNKINPAIVAGTVLNGSLVKTNKGYLFVSAALGKTVIDGVTVTALSPQSPLGQQLLGLQAGAEAMVNGHVYTIEAIT